MYRLILIYDDFSKARNEQKRLPETCFVRQRTSVMKATRWKKCYLTGDSRLDERNKALVALLADLRDELSKKEHCQEINELTERLSDLTKQRLSESATDSEGGTEYDATIQKLLKNDFPLASLSTPACRECALCDFEEERIANWLSQYSDKQNGAST